MIIIKQFCIYRQDVQANRNILYLFDDNLDREGFEGQAAEMRGEPNSFGIATKRSVTHRYPQDFFFDTDEDTLDIVRKEFEVLAEVIGRSEYEAMAIPINGIGTGPSKLPEYAPQALQFINLQLEQLKEI